MNPLEPSMVSRLLADLKGLLPPKDFEALEGVLARVRPEVGAANLADALGAIYGEANDERLKAFNNLRSRLKAVTAQAGMNGLQLRSDTRLRDKLADRTCWFEADDETVRRLRLDELNVLVGHNPLGMVVQRGRRMVDHKLVLSIGLVYDKKLRPEILPWFEELKKLNHPRWSLDWLDLHGPLPGEDTESYAARVWDADRVLVWTSDGLFNENVVANVAKVSARCAVVHFQTVTNLPACLGEKSWLLQGEPLGPGLSSPGRKAKAERLRDSVRLALDGADPVPSDGPGFESATLPERWIRPHAILYKKIPEYEEDAQPSGPGEDALGVLSRWAQDAGGQAYAVVLGEFGIGKTTLAQTFTLTQNRRRYEGENVPEVYYIDLRTYNAEINGGHVPPLNAFLEETLERLWAGGKPCLTAKDILHNVRTRNAILVFDGLDEKLVHLDGETGKAFLRELWSALPPSQSRESGSGARPAGQGRLLFTCRSHFFRSLSEQASALTAERTQSMSTQDYLCLALLPFNQYQIREYLGLAL
jgi:hypothetical protein